LNQGVSHKAFSCRRFTESSIFGDFYENQHEFSKKQPISPVDAQNDGVGAHPQHTMKEILRPGLI